MKMKFILLSVCLTVSLASVHAQDWSVGAHAGVNMSSFVGGNVYTVYEQGFKTGYEIGGDVRYTLKNGLNTSMGISLVQTGGEFSTTSSYYERDTQFSPVNARMLSLEIPLKIGYDFKVSHHLSFNPFVGAYSRYAFASFKDDVTITPLIETHRWNCFDDFNHNHYHLDGFQRFDAGVIVGVETNIAKHYVASFSYKRGLTELSKQFGVKSQTFTLSVGYCW